VFIIQCISCLFSTPPRWLQGLRDLCIFVYRFTFSFAFSFLSRFTFGFRSFRVFFCRDCASLFWGGWNRTSWPLNFRLRWLYASRLSSCGLSFYRSLFSSFSFPFPSIPLFFFSARVTVRQS
jgi:hypothetical protein